jgi:hyperosmotically inducible periplasmic protein
MKMTAKSYALLILATTSPWILRADPATDQRIEDTAKNSYNFHTVLQDRVRAEAKDGVVTLTGTVQDQNQKQLAEDTVSELPNVRRVDDQLTVQSPGPERSDAWIAFKIRSMLLVKPHVSSSGTHVDVKDGVVTLSGAADSVAQKELTETYVKDIEGVRSVTNDIQVTKQAYDDEHGRPATASNMDDASITAQVKWALTTHSSTSALKTKVRTDSGVVTVSGSANSDAEKDLVTRLAEDVRGVRSVNNEMTVK